MVRRHRRHKRSRQRRNLLAGIAVSIVVLAAGAYLWAGSRLGADDHFAEAQALLEQGQRDAALIAVKNALQTDPSHAKSRVLAAQLYLFLGDGLHAEKELREAIKLGVDTPELQMGLARAVLLQSRFEEVLAKLATLRPAEHGNEFYLVRAQAQLRLGRFDTARLDLDTVLKTDPDNAQAHRGLAGLALASQDIDEAGRQIDKSLEVATTDVEGWVLKGEVLLRQRDYQGAGNAFTTALDGNHSHLLARVGLTRALLAQNKSDEALEHIEILTKANPYSPVNSYLAALAFRQKSDVPAMQLALREVLKAAPNHAASLLMLGAIHYENAELELALELLSRFVQQQPDDLRGNKLLAAVLIKKENYAQGVAQLERMVAIYPDDPQLLALLGSAYMAAKDYEKANEYMSRASELEPDISSLRTQLALTHFATGDTDSGISELKSAAAAETEFGRADYLLLLVHLRQKEYSEALEIAENLAREQPDNPVPHNLIAAAHEGMGDLEKARLSYERALEIKPDYVTGALNLARLDYQSGNTQATKDRYTAVLTTHPTNIFALEGLARFALQEGHRAKAIDLLERARAASATTVNSRVLLVGIYLNTNLALALEIAEEAHALAAENPDVLEALARSQLANRRFSESQTSFKTLLGIKPRSANIHYQLGLAQAGGGDYQSARDTWGQVLEFDPGHLNASVALARLGAARGKPGEALTIARSLQDQHPTTPISTDKAADSRGRHSAE